MSKPTTLRSVQLEDGKAVYESDMPMRSLDKIMSAASESDVGGLMEGLSEFVVEWPFEGDPADPESWGDLRRSQFNEITTVVLKDLGELGNG